MSRQSRVALAAILGAAIGVGTLAGVIIAVRNSHDGGSHAVPAAPATDVADTSATGETGITERPVSVTRTVDVGGFPNAVAVGAGAVWVVRDGRRLIRIDPDSATVVARVGAGDELGSERPCGVAVGQGAVWVTTASGKLARINPQTKRLARLIELEDSACVATGAGSVWVTSPNRGLVTRIDAETNDIVGEIPVSGFPQGIAVGLGGVWVASADPPSGTNGAVTRINPGTNEVVESIPVPDLPEFLAAGAGGIWVTASNGTVRFLNPRSGRIDDTPVQVADEGRTIVTIGGGVVWASALTGPDTIGTAVQIDPTTRQATGDPIPVGQSPVGLAFGAGSLWVTNYSEGTVTAYTP